MRIVLIGQAAFGEAVLKRLLEKGEQVVGVSAPATPPGGRPDPLRSLAEQKGLPVFATMELKKDEVFGKFAALKADLGVMAFVTDILPEKVLSAPRLGTIQYHPSLLPRHRGANAMNWAIMKGERKTGLTVFWPDKGIDTGPVLLQKEAEITPGDTVGSLYFNKLFPLGVDAVAEAVDLVKQGKAPKMKQDESKATYEPIVKEEHAKIDWEKPAEEVYNLIRGCNPQPGAHTVLRYRKLRIFDCKLVPGKAYAKPGQVSGIANDSFTVALNGGSLQVLRVQPEGEPKIAVKDFVAAGRINAGDRLGA